ncbi:MAG: hypothetical protein FWF47_06640 [Clostridia bacterium]|nr:hypothetical protein [Clostridia bacterium]
MMTGKNEPTAKYAKEDGEMKRFNRESAINTKENRKDEQTAKYAKYAKKDEEEPWIATLARHAYARG